MGTSAASQAASELGPPGYEGTRTLCSQPTTTASASYCARLDAAGDGGPDPSTPLATPLDSPARINSGTAAVPDDCDSQAARAGSSSFSGKLRRFTERILKKAASPLLQTKVHDSSSAKLPLQSRRLAANPLSKVPVAKRGEILVTQRLGLTRGRPAPTESVQQEYDSMFIDKLSDTHEKAMRELFPDKDLPRRARGRRASHA